MQPYPDLGPHCTYRQATFSETALRNGITDNTPTAVQYANMKHVHDNLYVPVGIHFGIYPNINSFFRSDKLVKLPSGIWSSVNAIVGGDPESNHIRGMAMDMDYDNMKGAPSNIELFTFIFQHLSFYELICEVPDAKNNPAWVHGATNRDNPNRKKTKRMIYVKGEKVYQQWPWKWN